MYDMYRMSNSQTNLGNIFLIPSANKAKARREVAMISAGQQALKEVGDMENGSGGEGQEVPREEEMAAASVPALAPDRRAEVQTRLLKRRLEHLQEEAKAGDEGIVKRQRLTTKSGSGGLGGGRGGEDISSDLDLVSRVARMEADMAAEIQEDSATGRWIQRRLFHNLQERERLLEQFAAWKKGGK